MEAQEMNDLTKSGILLISFAEIIGPMSEQLLGTFACPNLRELCHCVH